MIAATRRCVLALGALALGTLACGERAAQDAPDTAAVEVPMPTAEAALIPTSLNYTLMQTALSIGDVSGFARAFTEDATMYVPSHGRMVGRDSIAVKFGREGLRLGIKKIRRESAGRYVEGREVVDSGRYVIESDLPLPENTLDAEGRYWTRWRVLPDGTWLIASDSLVGR